MSPLKTEILEEWVASFDSTELLKIDWTPSSLLEALQNKEVLYRLTPSGTLAAALIFHHVDINIDEILFLATRPGLRGQGLMWELLQDFASKKGDTQIWLECREDNEQAIQLYRKIGFIEAGRRLSYYKDGTAAILFNF